MARQPRCHVSILNLFFYSKELLRKILWPLCSNGKEYSPSYHWGLVQMIQKQIRENKSDELQNEKKNQVLKEERQKSVSHFWLLDPFVNSRWYGNQWEHFAWIPCNNTALFPKIDQLSLTSSNAILLGYQRLYTIGHDMYYPDYGFVHIKEAMLSIEQSQVMCPSSSPIP